MQETPIIPSRSKSLPLVSQQSSAQQQSFLNIHSNPSTSANFIKDNEPLRAAPQPSERINIGHALSQAQIAVSYDSAGNIPKALFFYREAMLSIHHYLYWDQTLSHQKANTSTKKEWEELIYACEKYKERVKELGESVAYRNKPHGNVNSVWSDKGMIKRNLFENAEMYVKPPTDFNGGVFWSFKRIKESMGGGGKNGSFITPKLYIPRLLWEQYITLPFSELKAGYFESMIPHYIELVKVEDAYKIQEIVGELNGIIYLMRNSLEKKMKDDPTHNEGKSKLWQNISPLFKGNSSFSNSSQHHLSSISSTNNILPFSTNKQLGSMKNSSTGSKTSISSPSKKSGSGFKKKLKRMTGKFEAPSYSDEYLNKLEDFIDAFLAIEFIGDEISTHIFQVANFLLIVIYSDIEYLLEHYLKGAAT